MLIKWTNGQDGKWHEIGVLHAFVTQVDIRTALREHGAIDVHDNISIAGVALGTTSDDTSVYVNVRKHNV